MPSTRCFPKVVTLGEEMFLLRGVISPPNEDEDTLENSLSENFPPLPVLAYHTVKDEWRVVQPIPQSGSGDIFIAQGKFHWITGTSIYVLDDEKIMAASAFAFNTFRC